MGSHLVEGRQNALPAIVQMFLDRGGPAPAGQIFFASILAGEKAGGQRVIGDDADAGLAANRRSCVFKDCPVAQIVERLETLVARQIVVAADLERRASRSAV